MQNRKEVCKSQSLNRRRFFKMNPAAFNYKTLAERCGLRSDSIIRKAVRAGELECRRRQSVVLFTLQAAYEWALKYLQIDITKTTVEPLKKR